MLRKIIGMVALSAAWSDVPWVAHNHGVTKDERLAALRTSCVERPEIDDHIIRPTIGSERGTYEVSWAGGSEIDLQRLRDEAARRGITLVLRRARYTNAQLHAAVEAIFDAEAELAEIGFELHGVCADPDPDGLVLEGADARLPDSADGEALGTRLVEAVTDHVAQLDTIREVFRSEDVRVEPGRVHLL